MKDNLNAIGALALPPPMGHIARGRLSSIYSTGKISWYIPDIQPDGMVGFLIATVGSSI